MGDMNAGVVVKYLLIYTNPPIPTQPPPLEAPRYFCDTFAGIPRASLLAGTPLLIR